MTMNQKKALYAFGSPDRRPLVSLYVLQSPLRDGSISALRKGF